MADGKMATAAMEQLTVQGASYRPVPIPVCCRWRPPVPKKNPAAVETDTVHQLTYRPLGAPQHSIKSPPPRDHRFLAGDGLNRFRCTSYASDYPVKTGQPGNNVIAADNRLLTHVSRNQRLPTRRFRVYHLTSVFLQSFIIYDFTL